MNQQAVYIFELSTRNQRKLRGVLAGMRTGGPGVQIGQSALASEVERERKTLKAGHLQEQPLVLLHDAAWLRELRVEGEPVRVSSSCAELRLWPVTDGELSSRILATLEEEPLVLASGHALYEAALDCSLAQSGIPLMATFVHRESGVSSRPVHRVVRGIQGFETGEFIRVARANFFFREASRIMRGLPPHARHPVLNSAEPHFDTVIADKLLSPEQAPPPLPTVTLEQAGARVAPGVARNSYVEAGDVAMLAVTRRATYRLHSKPGWADTILAHIPPIQRKLDVVQLHRIILEKVLKICDRDAREELHVSYHQDAEGAVAEVVGDAEIAFIMKALSLEEYWEAALSGAILPPRALDLAPEFPKGLIANALA